MSGAPDDERRRLSAERFEAQNDYHGLYNEHTGRRTWTFTNKAALQEWLMSRMPPGQKDDRASASVMAAGASSNAEYKINFMGDGRCFGDARSSCSDEDTSDEGEATDPEAEMPDLVPGCSGWGTRPPNGCVVHSLPSRGERVSWPSTITMTNSEVAAAFHYFRLHGNFFSAHDRAQASITSGHECRSTLSPCFAVDDSRSSGCEVYHVLLYRYGSSLPEGREEEGSP